MPKVGHVAKSRQRYKMVPVIDPATGKQAIQEINRKTRRGTTVRKALTEPDKRQPLPPFTCDSCRAPIPVGTPFKFISVKRQYGGITYRRHETCPTWKPWEYSTALWARIAQIQAMDVDTSGASPEDSIEDLVSDFAEAIRELAGEKEEGADNIESGFGHETEMSQQLRETAGSLNEWADEFENIDLPELDQEDQECQDCEGTGEIEEEGKEATECEQCGGEGTLAPEEPTEAELEDWRTEVASLIQDALDNAPDAG